MIKTTIEIVCDGGCGETVNMDGGNTQPLRDLSPLGWTFPVVSSRVPPFKKQKHYCPVCSRARLVGTV